MHLNLLQNTNIHFLPSQEKAEKADQTLRTFIFRGHWTKAPGLPSASEGWWIGVGRGDREESRERQPHRSDVILVRTPFLCVFSKERQRRYLMSQQATEFLFRAQICSSLLQAWWCRPFKTFPCLFLFPSSLTRANWEEWGQGKLRKYLKPIKCGYKFIVISKLIISFLTSSQSLRWACI